MSFREKSWWGGKAGLVAAVVVLLAGCGQNVEGRLAAESEGDLSNGKVERQAFDEILAAQCGDPAGDQEGADFLRSPYLQRVTERAAAVVWTAQAQRSPRVRVTRPDETQVLTAPAEVDSSAPLPRGRQYLAELDGLEPNTIYCYEVVDDDGPIFGRTGFRTAPSADSEAPIRFASFGDSGARTVDQSAVRDHLTGVPLDFVLHTGDAAYDHGTLMEFEKNFFDAYAELLDNVPFFNASGNHEYDTNEAAPFRQVFSLFENGGEAGRERWYSFDWGRVHIVVLDTERIEPAQIAWLERDLASTDRPWKVVVGHRPAYSSGTHGADADVREALVPLFEDYGVDLVLAGHDHHYERTETLNGVTYIVTGGGGVGTRTAGWSSFTAFAETVAHFLYVEIADGELRVYAIDGTGAQFDSVVLKTPR